MLILHGCAEVRVNTEEAIVPPRNNFIPIKGAWRVESGMNPTENKQELANSLVGKQAVFDEHIALLGSEICENPEYKIRSVPSADYFLYTYQIPYKEIGLMEPTIEIVSITAKDKHFYDFIRIDDQQLVVHKDDAFFYLRYISPEVNARVVDKINKKSIGNDPEIPVVESSLLRSGVLLGLRSPSQDVATGFHEEEWKGEKMNYRTLWIAAKNREIFSIEEAENLIIPRKSGFWIVESHRNTKDGYIQDYFTANPLDTGTEWTQMTGVFLQWQDDKQRQTKYKEEETIFPINLFKQIRFVGDDYAAIEYRQPQKNKGETKNYFQLVPIDNMNNRQGIDISDIAGDEGREILLNSAKGYLSNRNGNKIPSMEEQVREDYFTLERRNGHWLMKGRLYYADREEEPYVDYSINMIPPDKIVNYDELHISWNKIKDKVPEAIDAFVSPNKDMAIIITEKFIYIYELTKEELGGKPLEKVKLLDGEVVIMAEWATGNYVEKWKNFIIESLRPKLHQTNMP
jgi:hypothetical protein